MFRIAVTSLFASGHGKAGLDEAAVAAHYKMSVGNSGRKMKEPSISSEALNRDPLLVYDIVWSKLSTTVKVPDTLVFRNAELHSWLFTSSTGQVRRKYDKNCSLEAILDAFCKHRSPSDIVAYLLVKDYDVNIRYLTPETLREYILSRNKPLATCVVQKYVPPLGEDRSVLKVSYLSGHCISERYGVLDTFDSTRRSRRCHLLLSTFIKKPSFGAKIKLKELLVEDNVSNRVSSICSSIVKQVAECSQGDCHVRAFEAVFKFGSHNNPTLLWCANFDTYSKQGQLQKKLLQVEQAQEEAKLTLERQAIVNTLNALVDEDNDSEIDEEILKMPTFEPSPMVQHFLVQNQGNQNVESITKPTVRLADRKTKISWGTPHRNKKLEKRVQPVASEYSLGSSSCSSRLHEVAWQLACRGGK